MVYRLSAGLDQQAGRGLALPHSARQQTNQEEVIVLALGRRGRGPRDL